MGATSTNRARRISSAHGYDTVCGGLTMPSMSENYSATKRRDKSVVGQFEIVFVTSLYQSLGLRIVLFGIGSGICEFAIKVGVSARMKLHSLTNSLDIPLLLAEMTPTIFLR